MGLCVSSIVRSLSAFSGQPLCLLVDFGQLDLIENEVIEALTERGEEDSEIATTALRIIARRVRRSSRTGLPLVVCAAMHVYTVKRIDVGFVEIRPGVLDVVIVEASA